MTLIRAARQKNVKFHIDFHWWGIDLRILIHTGVFMVNFGINWKMLRIIIGEISYKLSIINYAPLKSQSNSGYDLELLQDVSIYMKYLKLSPEKISTILGTRLVVHGYFLKSPLLLYSLLFSQKPRKFWFEFAALGT